MNRIMTLLRRSIPLLVLAALSGAWFGEGAEATGAQEPLSGLEGFSAREESSTLPPVSIAFAKGADGDGAQDAPHPGWATLEWGKAMLGKLERPLTAHVGTRAEAVKDILAFRNWCTGAPGGGNLALAVSAGEVAMELLFRELADEHADPLEVRALFRRCAQDGLTPDYWLDTLALEGIDVDRNALSDKGAAEYLRMKAVFKVVQEKCAGPFAYAFFPAINWPRSESLDEFNPYALMWRTIALDDKRNALETCLAIQESHGSIPEEREEFRRTAEKCADNILRDRERLASWITAYDVWEYWTDALDAVRPGPKPRRTRR